MRSGPSGHVSKTWLVSKRDVHIEVPAFSFDLHSAVVFGVSMGGKAQTEWLMPIENFRSDLYIAGQGVMVSMGSN